MYFLKYLYNQPLNWSILKSIVLRQKLSVTKDKNDLKNRFITFASIFLLLLNVLRRGKKTTANYIICDSFISAPQIYLRQFFITHFNSDVSEKDVIVTNHKYFYYKKISLKIILNVILIWIKFVLISFLNIFIKNDYPTRFYYYIAANLINVELTQPKKVFLFQMYDTSTYLTALLLQYKHSNVYLSASNSIIFPFNRYTYLENVSIILCNEYQKKEVANYQNFGWFKAKETLYWGVEEILEHNKIEVKEPKIDIGIYSTGFWARKGLNREQNIDAIRNYTHIENPLYILFIKIIETIIEIQETTDISVKIYTHPIERTWYNEHNIKPPYMEFAEKNKIEVDLSTGNSLSKLYEVKIGIGTISTVMLDRWYHELVSLIYYNVEREKDFYRPKYLGNYSENFYQEHHELKPLILKKLAHLAKDKN